MRAWLVRKQPKQRAKLSLLEMVFPATTARETAVPVAHAAHAVGPNGHHSAAGSVPSTGDERRDEAAPERRLQSGGSGVAAPARSSAAPAQQPPLSPLGFIIPARHTVKHVNTAQKCKVFPTRLSIV